MVDVVAASASVAAPVAMTWAIAIAAPNIILTLTQGKVTMTQTITREKAVALAEALKNSANTAVQVDANKALSGAC